MWVCFVAQAQKGFKRPNQYYSCYPKPFTSSLLFIYFHQYFTRYVGISFVHIIFVPLIFMCMINISFHIVKCLRCDTTFFAERQTHQRQISLIPSINSSIKMPHTVIRIAIRSIHRSRNVRHVFWAIDTL